MSHPGWEHEIHCPECWQMCDLCSANRLMCRVSGCLINTGPGAGGKHRHCSKGDAVKGTECSICDGSGFVVAKTEIIRPAQGRGG